MKPHLETHHDGTMQGRDPRKLTPADLEACGIARQSRGEAIRANCVACCAGNAAEVRRCALAACALWPFRMGTDPWRAPREMSDDQRAAAAERLARGKAQHAVG